MRKRERREALEHAYALVAGKLPSGAALVPSATVAPRRRGERSRNVDGRKEAMVNAFRTFGPMGPGDLLEKVRASYDPEATRAQVTDVLRRMDDTFVSLGGGDWGLKEAGLLNGSGNSSQGGHHVTEPFETPF